MDLDSLKNNPEQIQSLIELLTSLLPDTNKPKKKKKPSNNINSKTRSKKYSQDTHENRFLTMGVKDLHKEDVIIDKSLNKFPPTPRNRSFKPVNVVCRSCGKKESVNPILIHDTIDRYKCNKCSINAG